MGDGKNPLSWLQASGAQRDVIDGLARFTDWRTLWSDCPRGDWLLGIATRLGVDHVALVRAAIACARIVDAPGVEEEADGAETIAHVLDVAQRWTEGRATASEVTAATRKLETIANGAADRSSEASARAVLAVGLGVADRDVLVVAASAAAESVILSSIDCGFELAMRWAHDKCAAAVREAVPWEIVEPCVERLGSAV